jgi:Phospholipid-translocating P-type ATPase C-terminal
MLFGCLMNSIVYANGGEIDLLEVGNMVFTSAVLITNFKILILSYSYNLLLILLTFGSIFVYFVTYMLESELFPLLPIGKTFFDTFSIPTVYLVFILVLFYTSVIDLAYYRRVGTLLLIFNDFMGK